ncbi:molybdopterin-dependent oxidoreductase [Guyparkeria sp.]|uniref:molybdopterin-dependent oxidoreductase n=1 Tax=Guyparkeria sp. TaxID=2035736 RepID=UPI00356B487A
MMSEEARVKGRRRFFKQALGVGGGALLVGVVGSEEQSPEKPPAPTEPMPTESARLTLPGKDMDALISHGMTPPTLETRREFLGTSVVTATPRHFVRQNLPLPPEEIVADRAGWSLQVQGVRMPGQITVGELQRLGLMTVAAVLQCSGNGRRFFEHGPSGSPWGVGAAGCAVWSGVKVSTVLEHFGGVSEDARFLTATGGEPLPEGIAREDVVVERSIPIDKALDDCLLAWEMNGEPIPLVHGGPLRLIVPGYYGVNQIKFVQQIACTAQPTDAKIHSTGYRFRDVGQGATTDQPSMWAMGPKSFVTYPTARTPQRAGLVQCAGVAFGGTEPVAKVEVSSDGETWREAALIGPDLGPYAWRVFHLAVEAPAGALPLFSRVTTVSGRIQPENRIENERGYGNDSWRDMGVVVQVCGADDEACLRPPEDAPSGRRRREGPVELSEAGQRGRAIFREQAQPTCATCHALAEAEAGGTVGPNLDELGPSLEQVHAAVANGVGTMPSYTQLLTPEQIDDVAAYVFEATR